MHKLLVRQLRRAGLDADALPEGVKALLALVDAAYVQADDERGLIERSLELMSKELTERNQALRDELGARKRGEEELLRILENLPQAIMVRDGDRIVYVNGTSLRLLKHTNASEVVGRQALDLVAPADREAVAVHSAQAAEGLPIARRELRLLAADGSTVLVEPSMVEHVDFGGKPCVLVAYTNVSLLRELQSHVQIADRMASLGTMAAGVAHEINNPLAYVLANLDYAIETIDAARVRVGPEAQFDDCMAALADAKSGARRVQKIVSSLKTFSRVDEDARAPIAINDVLETAIQLSMNQLRHSARLVRRFESSPIVFANEGRLAQVFVNLLINAAQAIPDEKRNSATITVRTRVSTKDRAVVEITDTGAGIPAYVLPRIFEPFFTTKPHGIGTGLGLSICHGIVQALGGSMEVESKVGEGTTFRVTLPRRARGTSISSSRPATPSPRTPPLRARVMVVDDEEAIGAAVRRVLLEHDVVTAPDARTALRIMREGQPFDVVLCDIMMPDVTGAELFDAVKSKDPRQASRFIFLTGGAFTAQTQEFMEKAEQPKLMKPFSAADIRDAVARMLAMPEPLPLPG